MEQKFYWKIKKKIMDKLNKERMKAGRRLNFTGCDDIMTISFKRTLGGSMEWIIELNCVIIQMTKTFKPFEKKVDWLIESRGLELEDQNYASIELEEGVLIHETDPEEKHWQDVATYGERFSGDDY